MTEVRPGDPDDAALVREVAGGSYDALSDLYDRHASAIFAVARRLTTDRGVAEEVVQDTFLALWDRAETFDPASGSLAAWLHTIARNRTVDRLRAMGRRYSVATYLRRLEPLREEFNLTSDVIVGFPTEDAQAFANTLRVVGSVTGTAFSATLTCDGR